MAKKVGYIAADAKLAQIAVRLPQKELNKISRLAARSKLSVSAYMRNTLINSLKAA